MAIGTPVLVTPAVGATATSVTTASFTPTAGHLLLAFATARPTAADIPTISDTLGNTWTQVGSPGTDFGNITAKLWYQVVESSPAARTVTASSTGSTQVGLAIVAISGAGTDFSNFQANTNAAGDPSVTMSSYAGTSAALGFYAGNAGGSNVTIPTGYTSLTNSQIATNIRFAVVYDTTSPSTTQTWTGVSTDSICFGVEIKEPAAGAYTLTANTAAVTLTGTSATLKADRRLSSNTAGVALTGSAATLRHGYTLAADSGSTSLTGSPVSLRVARRLTADTNDIAVSGQQATLTYAPSSSSQPEVNWPGTNIPRSRFKEMQRAALSQYLQDERERLQGEAGREEAERPTQRKVKRAVARVIRRIEGEGLLTSAQTHEAAPAIKQAITSNVSIRAIMDQLRLSELTFIAEQQLLDDEAAAILLLAA